LAWLPLTIATNSSSSPTPQNKWFKDSHLTQLRLLRYKVFGEACLGTLKEDTILEIVWCEDSRSELAATSFSNTKEPALGLYQKK